MRLLNLFRKSDWRKLEAFPAEVRRDIACLIVLDQAIAATALHEVQSVRERGSASSIPASARLLNALSEDRLISELQIAVLSTGTGKELEAVQWEYLPPVRAVGILGILAMTKYRGVGRGPDQANLEPSGYSAHPDEARTQLLVLVAQAAGVKEFEQVRDFDLEFFRPFWLSMRRAVFLDIPTTTASGSQTLSRPLQQKFEQYPPSVKDTFLQLANMLASGPPNATAEVSIPKVARPKFDLKESQALHPFGYVPYTAVVRAMGHLATKLSDEFLSIAIDDSEIRRVAAARVDLRANSLTTLLQLDFEIAAYCITVAGILATDPEFPRWGVWKKLTEAFENKNKPTIKYAAQLRLSGLLGNGSDLIESKEHDTSSLSLNFVQNIRSSPKAFRDAKGSDLQRISVLLGGTLVLRHILSHPRYGKDVTILVTRAFDDLVPLLEEMKTLDPLTWDQQLKLEG